MSSHPPRRSDLALQHLDAVAAAREALAVAYDSPSQSRDRIGQLHQSINFGLKFAEVHALVAIADALEGTCSAGSANPPTDPAVPA